MGDGIRIGFAQIPRVAMEASGGGFNFSQPQGLAVPHWRFLFSMAPDEPLSPTSGTAPIQAGALAKAPRRWVPRRQVGGRGQSISAGRSSIELL